MPSIPQESVCTGLSPAHSIRFSPLLQPSAHQCVPVLGPPGPLQHRQLCCRLLCRGGTEDVSNGPPDLQPYRLTSCFSTHSNLKSWFRTSCTSEHPAPLWCVNVYHFCQLRSDSDPLFVAIFSQSKSFTDTQRHPVWASGPQSSSCRCCMSLPSHPAMSPVTLPGHILSHVHNLSQATAFFYSSSSLQEAGADHLPSLHWVSKAVLSALGALFLTPHPHLFAEFVWSDGIPLFSRQ